MLYLFQEVIIVAENKLADLSMDFAVKVLKMTDDIKGHYNNLTKNQEFGGGYVDG